MKNKLTSRKFWALVAALLTSNLLLFGVAEEVVVQVSAIVMQFGAIIVYIFSEASIDKEKTKSNS
jgi:hypothetical protein